METLPTIAGTHDGGWCDADNTGVIHETTKYG